MFNRTFGWVQNPSDFTKLKRTVQLFDATSAHYQRLRTQLIQEQIIYFEDLRQHLQEKLDNHVETFNYGELVGTSRDKTGKATSVRAKAEANSLIQISWLPQQAKKNGKAFTDNWTADGFLRWAVSLNFVQHDRETDFFSLTPLGRQFSQTADESSAEKDLLTTALLSYPPITQVLTVLTMPHSYKTKFFIGDQLGFRGEKGFSSYNEGLMIDWLTSAPQSERSKIRSDVEGTSDKYARMICGWLKKLALVSSTSQKLTQGDQSFANFQGYQLTAKGLHALKQTNGSSKSKRAVKYIMWEFLATDGKNRDYVRTRRSYILKFLQETTSFKVLLTKLKQKGFDDDERIIETDISGLNTFGLRIERTETKIELKDLINDFTIPQLNVTATLKDAATEKRKAVFMRQTNLAPKYIELLEIAYDGTRNRDFEIVTAELFRNVYGLNSVLLGGGRKPDALVFTENFGLIIDTKAYGEGYAKSISQADEMIRYIEDNQRRDLARNPFEWWAHFDSNIPTSHFYFLWISSHFVGRFQEQLDYTASQTNSQGGALTVEQLLLGADAVTKGLLNPEDLPNYLTNTVMTLVGE